LQVEFLNCFNQYDIRGIVGKELTTKAAYQLGRLFALKSVVIAKDSRSSSNDLLIAFSKGLLDSGCIVFELEGVSSSPLLYFASFYLETAGAVMITGSHNPLEYNGFKFMKDGKPFYGEALKQIINNLVIDAVGSHQIIDLRAKYLQTLLKNIQITRKFKIAWECNNSGIAPLLECLSLLGEHLLLNISTDGNFAHTPPDPLLENNLDQIKQVITENKCDFGFAFDGDGDRLVLITSDGKALTSDQLIYLISLSIKNSEKRKVILDMKSSQILVEQLQKDGFEVIMVSGGHSIMKDKIVKEDAILAGEASGHLIINDSKYYPLDDALYIALRLVEYLQNNPIIELQLAFIRREFKIPKSFDILEKIKAYNNDVSILNGIRKIYSDGWWLIRASNTENHILIKYEAMSQEAQNKIIKELLEFINMPLSLM